MNHDWASKRIESLQQVVNMMATHIQGLDALQKEPKAKQTCFDAELNEAAQGTLDNKKLINTFANPIWPGLQLAT